MKRPESGVLTPEIDAMRQRAADFLAGSMRHGRESASVRIGFDKARYFEGLLKSAVRVQALGQELVHDPDESAQAVARSYGEVDTLVGLLEYHRQLDMAA